MLWIYGLVSDDPINWQFTCKNRVKAKRWWALIMNIMLDSQQQNAIYTWSFLHLSPEAKVKITFFFFLALMYFMYEPESKYIYVQNYFNITIIVFWLSLLLWISSSLFITSMRLFKLHALFQHYLYKKMSLWIKFGFSNTSYCSFIQKKAPVMFVCLLST